VREVWVTRSRRSPVRQAALTYFANFNPVASHVPLLPIGDWCLPGSDQHAAYDGAARAVVSSWAGTDQATGKASSVAVALGFDRQLAAERSDWHGFLARTRLPAGAPRRVVEVAKRSLIGVRLARVPETGAIVASVNTQGPYGEDWIRDGAFINRLLDENGYTSLVTQHNLFYARIQASPANPSAIRPPGNWTMA